MSKPELESSTIVARVRTFLIHRWAESVLGLIIVSAGTLSLFWVFTVPMLQNPDETSHIDYAFSIYSAGRLLNVRTPPSEWNVHSRFEGRAEPGRLPYEFMSHQYTLYLIEVSEFQRIRFHYEEKAPPNYGTPNYYRNLDLNAPQQPAKLADLKPEDNPWLLTAYPFGYYVLVAIWMKILSLFGGPAMMFLGARILSVILLIGSLVLTYATLREFRLRKGRALALTFIVAFFPLTTFISSSVQPDNLTLFLVLACFYTTQRLQQRAWSDRRLLMLLGLALGALVVTKYHISVFTIVAILATQITDHIFRRKSLIILLQRVAILLLPATLFFLVQLWVVWGGGRITGSNLYGVGQSGVIGGTKQAMLDYYRGGPALVSWWGTFGWMDAALIIRSPAFQSRVLLLLSMITLLVLLLVLFRFEQVLTRLIVFASRGRWRMSLRTAFSNPMLISHFIFTVFMILLYALTDNSFYAQGRHWFPYTLSGFLIAIQFAPRALTHRKTQAAVSALFLIGVMVYCVVGSYYSVRTIKARFYAAAITPNVSGG